MEGARDREQRGHTLDRPTPYEGRCRRQRRAVMRRILPPVETAASRSARETPSVFFPKTAWQISANSPSSRQILLKIEQSFKTHEFTQEREFHDTGGAVALFGNNQFGKPGVFLGRLVNFFAVNEHDHIRVLLDGAHSRRSDSWGLWSPCRCSEARLIAAGRST